MKTIRLCKMGRKIRMKSFFAFACAQFCATFIGSLAYCQVPQTLTYSGILSEGGVPAEASVRLTFTLYAASGEIDVWSETFDNVDVNNGRFNVALGSTENIVPVLDGNVYWLEVSVNDGPGLLPRSAFNSVPYAIRARDTDTLNGSGTDI
jgi:hypothetical protein